MLITARGEGQGSLGAREGGRLLNPGWVPKGFLEGHPDPDGKLGGQKRERKQCSRQMEWHGLMGTFPPVSRAGPSVSPPAVRAVPDNSLPLSDT